MRGILFSIFALSLGAFAQQDQQTKQDTPVVQVASDDRVWVELQLANTKNGGFGDAVAQSDTGGWATGVNFGLQPFKNLSGDSLLKKIVRNVGMSLNLTMEQTPPYDVYLGSIVEVVPTLEINSTCGGRFGNGKRCVPCGYEDFVGRTCTVEDVFGRVENVKFTKNSVALGFYVPMKIADRLVVQAGVNMRAHLTKEGQISTELDSSWERTYAATLRVAYPIVQSRDRDTGRITQTISATGGFEQSFFGSKSGDKRFKYRTYTFGVAVAW